MGGPRLGADGVEPDGTRRCWSCDEVVAPHAIACRHCGASLVEPDSDARQTDEPEKAPDPLFANPRPGHAPASDDPNEPRLDSRPHFDKADREPPRRPTGGRRDGARARRSADEPVDDIDEQWSDSDFERISQTAGLPREDPRKRRTTRTGRNGSHRRAGTHAGERLGRVWSEARNLRPHRALRWLGFALVLVVVGSAAGWAAGRWDAGSWIAERYAHASAFVQSLTTAPGDGEQQTNLGTTPSPSATSSPNSAAAMSGGAEQAGASAEPPPEATVVEPRAAVPPSGPGTSGPGTQETASLVPIKPSSPAEPAAAQSAPPSEPSSQSTSEPRTSQPAKPWSVLDVQRELARLGYYQGGLDGQVGPLTRRAVKEFQEATGLRPTGRIEPKLVNALASQSTADATSATPEKSP